MRRILAAALLSLALPTARAASIDCKQARTPREHAICSDPKLSALDAQLAAAYKSAQAKLSPAAFALVQSDQREWLRWLDKVCPPVNPSEQSIASCLTNRNSSRLQQLTTGIQLIDGVTFYPRTHFVFVLATPSQRDEPHSDNDPGFGYGEFAWPQIDKPTPTQAAWNTAIYDATTKVEGDTPDQKTFSLDASVNSRGNSYGFYTLIAANERLINVALGIETYGWGAAHPNATISSFLWWLNERRDLVANDVFRPGTNWTQELINPIIQKLHADLGDGFTWKGDQLNKAVAEGLADTHRWSISSTGLTITYGQYAVAPYVAGMPSVTFAWSELQPYLNPSLHPETLPPLLPKTEQSPRAEP